MYRYVARSAEKFKGQSMYTCWQALWKKKKQKKALFPLFSIFSECVKHLRNTAPPPIAMYIFFPYFCPQNFGAAVLICDFLALFIK